MSGVETKWVDIESLAMSLYEAGRSAVVAEPIMVACEFSAEEITTFRESLLKESPGATIIPMSSQMEVMGPVAWDDLSNPAKDLLRRQAAWLLDRYRITRELPLSNAAGRDAK